MWGAKTKQLVKRPKKHPTLKQEMVLRAIQVLEPCHYRQISQYLHVIEGRVTPRIAELRKKGFVKISYTNKGLDGVRVNYYRTTLKGLNFLMEEDSEFLKEDVA